MMILYLTSIRQVDRLEWRVVLLVVGKPEPDVIRPQEVCVPDEGDLLRDVPVQVVRENHVPELEPQTGVLLVVPVEEELQSNPEFSG